MDNRLFATKPLEALLSEAQRTGEHALRRTMGSLQLVALGVGGIIGAGIFTLTGIAAATKAGPALTISFVLAAVGCGFAGLCYSEFSTMIPIAGSAYTYSYATMGELLPWIIGWDLKPTRCARKSEMALSLSVPKSCPPTKMVPWVGLSIQPMRLSRVVFPLPEGPTIMEKRWRGISKVMPLIADTYCFYNNIRKTDNLPVCAFGFRDLSECLRFHFCRLSFHLMRQAVRTLLGDGTTALVLSSIRNPKPWVMRRRGT
jgi:Amino acid permease